MTLLTFFSQNRVMIMFRMPQIVSTMFYNFWTWTSFTNIWAVKPHSSMWWEHGDKPSYKCKKSVWRLPDSYLVTYFQSFFTSQFYVKISFENTILCTLKHKHKLRIITGRALATNLIHFNLNPHKFNLESSTSGIHSISPKSIFINI